MINSKMLTYQIKRRACILCALTLISGLSVAQNYPSKPINLIVPFPAGGASDAQFRLLSNIASKELKQTIVVLNQPGVAGTLAPSNMARNAAPDGYTIAVIASSVFRVPHVQKVAYDPTKDFTYIAGISKFIYALAVPADSPFQSAKDLVNTAKSKPGQVSVGAISSGSSGHIALMRWAKQGGFEPNFVPFKGSAEAIQALLGKHIDAMTEASWAQLVNQGRLRLLAVFEDQRLKQFPNVPTFKELGWNVSANAVVGLAGPKGMDPAVVKTLERAFEKASADTEFLKALDLAGQSLSFLDSNEYTRQANDLYQQERRNIEELKAAGVNLGN